MKYKLFLSDYDGTLGLAPKNDIDSGTLEAINRFTKKGGIFVVCSGRETSSINKILRKHGLKGLVVSFQGSRISDIESGQTIFEGGLSCELAIKAVEEIRNAGLSPIAYGEEGFYIEKRSPYVEVYENATGLKGVPSDIVAEIKKQKGNVCKVCGLGDDTLVNLAVKKLNQVYNRKEMVFNSGATCLIEAINPSCDKGNAVRFLAKRFNIPLEKVIAVGDSTNDIGLISGPWHGVAVGDGKEELKAVADEITVPFKDNPVKYLLEKYCL